MNSDHRAVPPLSPRDFVRFWTKVEVVKMTDCWTWRRAKNNSGYGVFQIKGYGTFLAHRISWYFSHLQNTLPLHVLHKCNNPSCVNPLHLYLGDDHANLLDSIRAAKEEGRTRLGCFQKGEKHSRSKLTEEKVLLIRKLYTQKESTMVDLAHCFRVSRSTIQGVIERRNWTHI